MLLDRDMNVTHTSDFISYDHWETLEINDTLLYSMYDGSNYCLSLVQSDNLLLLNKHKLSYNHYGFSLSRLDDSHVILG